MKCNDYITKGNTAKETLADALTLTLYGTGGTLLMIGIQKPPTAIRNDMEALSQYDLLWINKQSQCLNQVSCSREALSLHIVCLLGTFSRNPTFNSLRNVLVTLAIRAWDVQKQVDTLIESVCD